MFAQQVCCYWLSPPTRLEAPGGQGICLFDSPVSQTPRAVPGTE